MREEVQQQKKLSTLGNGHQFPGSASTSPSSASSEDSQDSLANQALLLESPPRRQPTFGWPVSDFANFSPTTGNRQGFAILQELDNTQFENLPPCPPHHLAPKPRKSFKKVQRSSSHSGQENQQPLSLGHRPSGKEIALLQRQREAAEMGNKSNKKTTWAERMAKRQKRDGKLAQEAAAAAQAAQNAHVPAIPPRGSKCSKAPTIRDFEKLLAENAQLKASGVQGQALMESQDGGQVSFIQQKEQELRAREAELATREAQLGKGQPLLLQKGDDVQKMVYSAVKQFIYRGTKFVTNDAHLEKITGKVYDILGYGHETQPKGHRESWIATYKSCVNKGLNEARSYVQQQLVTNFKSHVSSLGCEPHEIAEKSTFITFDLAKKCALREIDWSKVEERQAMMWYVEVGLQKELGYSEWGPSKHLYILPSQAMTDRTVYGKETKLVTPESEAMLCMALDNCLEKWVHCRQYELEQYYDSMSSAKKKKFKYPEEKVGDKMRTQKKYLPKYTDLFGGKKVIDGWSRAGKKAFLDLRAEIKEAHKNNPDKVLALERECLDALRQKWEITAPDPDTHKKNKRKRQGEDDGDATVGEEAEEEELDMDFSDEEE